MTKVALKIDGRLLRQDREEREFSRLALIVRIREVTSRNVSESTIRRAEESDRVGEQKLKWISRALGFPPTRYTTQNGPLPHPIGLNLSGWWSVFYREDDVHTDSYVARERLHITQKGQAFSGVYEPSRSDHPLGHAGPDAFTMIGLVGSDAIYGSYARGSPSPQGSGVFHLKFLRGGGWGEGLCSFVGDDAQIMVSLNIWVREDHPEFDLMKAQAEFLMLGSHIFPSLPVTPFLRHGRAEHS